jgi:hypothetical protein
MFQEAYECNTFLANRRSVVFDDAEIVNMNNSKGVGVQQITCTGKK